MICVLVSQGGHRAKTQNTKVIQKSMLLWKKEVMPHQSSKAFSEVCNHFCSWIWSVKYSEDIKSPWIKDYRERMYCAVRGIFLLHGKYLILKR